MSRTIFFSLKFFISLVAFIVCIVIFSLHVRAQPDEILLTNDKVFLNKKKPPVMFPHAAHMDRHDCLECHHRMQNGENVLDAGDLEEESPGIHCKDCHTKKNFKFSSELDHTQRGLMHAYHKQCISCHRTEEDPKGPRTCNGCHKK